MGFGGGALGEHFSAGCKDMLQDPGPLGVGVGVLEGFPFVNVVLESFFDFAYKFVGSEGGMEGFGERVFVPSGIFTGGARFISEVDTGGSTEGAVVASLGHGDKL